MKNLTLVFHHLGEELLGKDVFLVPYYLSKRLGMSLTIVYKRTPFNSSLPSTYKGANLIPLTGRFLYASLMYIKSHARNIDVLMLFHTTWRSSVLAKLYRAFNKRGRIYLKMDISVYALDYLSGLFEAGSLGKLLERKAILGLIKRTNIFTCETQKLYNAILSSPIGAKIGSKLVWMPNGFDEAYRVEAGIEIKDFCNKENIMLTVGRLGTPQKNTEMLLEALSNLDLKDWTFYCIGNIEEHFKQYINEYFTKHPDHKAKIIFTGAITDKQKLWDYYNRAKVFVLTSRWESYGLVLNEAYRFKDYIVSTDVGAAQDIIRDNVYGKIIEIDDVSALAETLRGIINNDLEINVYKNHEPMDFIYENMVKKITF